MGSASSSAGSRVAAVVPTDVEEPGFGRVVVLGTVEAVHAVIATTNRTVIDPLSLILELRFTTGV
jgi:hypothetical protein